MNAAYRWGVEHNPPEDQDFALFGIQRNGRSGFRYYPDQGVINTPEGAVVPAPTLAELEEWAKGL